ncbi:hypothetical protein CPB83DRAFT_909273 [Crepidotus variabilis]|uniref:Uncharacterized protein n=1 Tax=Crepidotus variabilis TaxID=179855 RepID=A0A9P6EAA6_9AGAR|nr:hypothetical protein CPB83DRAFT_909273 [Crepidotus variabilis]
MVLFAFSSTPSEGYVVSCGTGSAWSSIPEGLVTKIKEAASGNDNVLSVSIGKNDWFINTTTSVGCHNSGAVMTFLTSPEAQAQNIKLADIESFIFMPHNPTGYFCETDKSQYWDGLPKSLSDNIRFSTSKFGIRCITVGAEEQWVIVRNDGSMAFSGITENLANKLKESRAANKNVKFITLSFDNPDLYFIEFEDCSTMTRLPPSWQERVQEYTKKSLDMVTRAGQVRGSTKTVAAVQRIADQNNRNLLNNLATLESTNQMAWSALHLALLP